MAFMDAVGDQIVPSSNFYVMQVSRNIPNEELNERKLRHKSEINEITHTCCLSHFNFGVFVRLECQ